MYHHAGEVELYVIKCVPSHIEPRHRLQQQCRRQENVEIQIDSQRAQADGKCFVVEKGVLQFQRCRVIGMDAEYQVGSSDINGQVRDVAHILAKGLPR